MDRLHVHIPSSPHVQERDALAPKPGRHIETLIATRHYTILRGYDSAFFPT